MEVFVCVPLLRLSVNVYVFVRVPLLRLPVNVCVHVRVWKCLCVLVHVHL
jgi:hypothetical protein